MGGGASFSDQEEKDQEAKKEGFGNSEWIILDYVNTVVHIFKEEARDFYNIDGLWADAKITKIKE